jgi:hypothetical protein
MQKRKLAHSNINVRYWIIMCVSIYINKCNVQHLNNGFDKLKVANSSHVEMFIIQEMWKNSLNYPNIIAKYWIACVLIYYNKCKM